MNVGFLCLIRFPCDTARPLAKLWNITPQIVPVYEGKARENIEAVAAALRRHKDETVLVVGHITVTAVIAALGENGPVRLLYGAPEDISRRCRLESDQRRDQTMGAGAISVSTRGFVCQR